MSVSHVNTGYSVNQDSKTFTIMPLWNLSILEQRSNYLGECSYIVNKSNCNFVFVLYSSDASLCWEGRDCCRLPLTKHAR